MSALSLFSAVITGPNQDLCSVMESMASSQQSHEVEKRQIWTDASTGVGLAASGGDPKDVFFRSDEGNPVVVFAGRITNTHALKRQKPDLAKAGFAEIISRLYSEHGIACLEKIEGYFCFILWDDKRKELHAVRDYLGSFPIFYAQGKDNSFLISSRIPSILATNLVTEFLDEEAIAHYLHDKSFLPPSTPFKNIRSLPLGTRLVFKQGKVVATRYFRPSLAKEEMDEEEAVSRADELLRAILEEQIAPFDRIGVCFSGGTDSILLTAMLKALTDKPVHTYTVWTGTSREEARFSHEAAEYFGTSHRMITLNGSVIKRHIPEIIEAYPTPGVGGWHIYLATKGAQDDGLGICFSGHGAEISFGLDWHQLKFAQLHSLLRFLDYFPTSFQKKALTCLNNFLDRQKINSNQYSNLRLFRSYMECKLGIQHWNSSKLTENRIYSLFSTDTNRFSSIGKIYRQYYKDSGSNNFLDQLIYSRLVSFEGNHAQGKNNYLALQNEVELAVPFMDRRFLNFGLKIPNKLKNLHGQYKYLEVKLAKRYHCFERKKAAFSMPFGQWLKKDLKDIASEVFQEKNIKRLHMLRHEAVYELWSEYLQGNKTLHWTDIQAFISLILWLQLIKKERLKKHAKFSATSSS